MFQFILLLVPIFYTSYLLRQRHLIACDLPLLHIDLGDGLTVTLVEVQQPDSCPLNLTPVDGPIHWVSFAVGPDNPKGIISDFNIIVCITGINFSLKPQHCCVFILKANYQLSILRGVQLN